MSTVAWCKHPVTFVPLIAPNPDDDTAYREQETTMHNLLHRGNVPATE